MKNNHKILVTGGSGYFGSLLINKLLNKGFEVGSLDINNPQNKLKKVKYHLVDIRNKKALSDCVSGYNIIFHNVAQVPLVNNKRLFKEVNINGTDNVCSSAVINKVKTIVYISSSAVYGVPSRNPVTEQTRPTPMEEYGQAKYEAELICKKYADSGINISIIRPRTILGHGRLGLFSILFKWVKEGYNIPVLDKGKNIYQFVHADDLAEACIAVLNVGNNFNLYNIGAKDYGTMYDVLEHLCFYANTGSKITSLPLRPIEMMINISSKLGIIPLAKYHSLMYGRSLYFDISKAENELGYSPNFSNNKMIIDSYKWYLKNMNLFDSNSDISIHKKPLNEKLLRLVKWIL